MMKRPIILLTIIVIFLSCDKSNKTTVPKKSIPVVKLTENETSNGLIIKESTLNFEATYKKLKTTIENNPNLKVLLELDHSNNASSVNLKLNPTKIIMFGNPKMGTPLMSSQQTTAIDLPQKMIVFKDNAGKVNVAYNSPLYLQKRHEFSYDNNIEIIKKMTMALDKISNSALE